jgi:hypothetical protein
MKEKFQGMHYLKFENIMIGIALTKNASPLNSNTATNRKYSKLYATLPGFQRGF